MKPLHGHGKGGSHVEWFIGGRFTTIKAQDSYNYNPGERITIQRAGDVIPNPNPPPFFINTGTSTDPLAVYPSNGISPSYDVNNTIPGGTPPGLVAANLNTRQYTPLGVMAENSIFGPQLGVRWFRQRGRWNISAEGRGFFAVNRQEITGGYSVQEPTPRTSQSESFGSTLGHPITGVINGIAALDDPFQTLVPEVPKSRQVQTYHEKQWKWAPAGDVRVNATWEITKSFALEAGWEWLYFANGIARGKTDGPNNFANQLGVFGLDNQDMMFTGWTVGFVVNR